MAVAKSPGRIIKVVWNSHTLILQQKDMKLNGAPIDITDDSDNGWVTYLDDVATKSVEISVSGVMKNADIPTDWFGAGNGKTVSASTTLSYVGSGTPTTGTDAAISGTFVLQDYSEGMPHDGAITFSATLASSGTVTYTAAT